MSGKTGIKIYAPAAIGNFGAGMNIMSAAIESPGDELIAVLDSKIRGVHIESIIGHKKGLSYETALNSASLAGQLLLDHLGDHTGIKFKIHKKIALNSGFSSNASSAVAGVFAVNELIGRPMERYDLIDFALKAARKFDINAFPSQVASILFGGIILYRSEEKDSFQKIYCPDGIQLTLIIPEIRFSEMEKLQFLQKGYNLDENISSHGNTAGFISALYTSDFNLFKDCLLEKPVDAGLLKVTPFFNSIKEITIQNGGFGCAFAGNGPGIYIASPNTLIAEEITQLIEPVMKSFKTTYQCVQTKIDLNGVYKF